MLKDFYDSARARSSFAMASRHADRVVVGEGDTRVHEASTMNAGSTVSEPLLEE